MSNMIGSKIMINKENINPSTGHFEADRYSKKGQSREIQKRRSILAEHSSNRSFVQKTNSVTQESFIPRDPQNANDYQASIREYLRQKECFFQVNPLYMNQQKDINLKMRSILIDWLVDVNIKFKLLPNTFYLTVNLIDRFLSKEQIDRSQVQLVGISCLMIIAKFEEIYPPLLDDYFNVCDKAYTKQQIMEMESFVLLSINFNLTQTSSYVFLQQIQLVVHLDEKAFIFARYIIENALFDLTLLKHSNLVIAAGAVFLAHKIFKKDDWKRDFELKVGVSEKLARSCAKDLFKTMQDQDKTNLQALKRKFMSPEYFEVAKYRIEKVSNSG